MRGEACVVHLLEAALPCGSSTSSAGTVVLGSAVNQDGRSSSLTAPNGPSQQAVIRAALGWGQVAPWAVGVLEMHGTGGWVASPPGGGRAPGSRVNDPGSGDGQVCCLTCLLLA